MELLLVRVLRLHSGFVMYDYRNRSVLPGNKNPSRRAVVWCPSNSHGGTTITIFCENYLRRMYVVVLLSRK